MKPCRQCGEDFQFLQAKGRPDYELQGRQIRVVDLFSGCGGLSLGIAEGARRAGFGTDVALAIDINQDAADVLALNFPKANVICNDIAAIFNGNLGEKETTLERDLRMSCQEIDILVSGAPCQGHSDLNNHTRRRDPRNALYLRAVRAAEILRPEFVILENVPAVRRDSNHVVDVAAKALRCAGYKVADRVIHLSELGVPQTRSRHFLLAGLHQSANPAELLNFASPCSDHLPRPVRWAIGDLNSGKKRGDFDQPSKTTAENKERIDWLFENKSYDLPNKLRPECHHGEHSYRSMYGRLRWHEPAQTITTGYGSMGQGRYVHPSKRRTLTPHEAARLQTFPDFFDFGESKGRGAWSKMIGNAVPPLVTLQLTTRLLPILESGGFLQSPRSRRTKAGGSKRPAAA